MGPRSALLPLASSLLTLWSALACSASNPTGTIQGIGGARGGGGAAAIAGDTNASGGDATQGAAGDSTQGSGGEGSAGAGGDPGNGGEGVAGTGGVPTTIDTTTGPMHLVWDEEFDGPTLDTSAWTLVDGNLNVNNELEYYQSGNVTIQDGALVIEAREESRGGQRYTSGQLHTNGKKLFTYGRFTARIKTPTLQGMWPAFWMLGVYGGWPNGGELDIMEAKGREPTKIWGTAHWGPLGTNGSHPTFGRSITLPNGDDTSTWHEYSLEWTATSIRWWVDDNAGYQSLGTTAPFNKNFYVLLNLAVGGQWDNGLAPPANMAPQRMYVDYVRVYQP